jgi:putative ABC transport system substrate-binding protein
VPALGSERRRSPGGAATGETRRNPTLPGDHGLPAISNYPQWVRDGLLMSYGTEESEVWRRAADYVDRILKGATPANMPVEQPTKFELAINLKTAKALGLTIPQSILQLADEVIE